MKRKSLLLAFLGLSFWLVASTIAAQSLGDFARQQREKQKEAKKAAKVYTNDELPARPPREGPTAAAGISPTSAQAGEETGAQKPAAEAKPPEAPPPAQGEKAEDKTKTRDYWEGAFKAARDQLARAQEEQQLVQDEIQLLQMQDAREFQQDVKAEAARKIAARKAELETKLAATAKAQKALADLEQEFKESGAPEDWNK